MAKPTRVLSCTDLIWQFHEALGEIDPSIVCPAIAVVPMGKGSWTAVLGRMDQKNYPSLLEHIAKIALQLQSEYLLADG